MGSSVLLKLYIYNPIGIILFICITKSVVYTYYNYTLCLSIYIYMTIECLNLSLYYMSDCVYLETFVVLRWSD